MFTRAFILFFLFAITIRADEGMWLFNQPPRERAVVRLFYIDGKSYEEISKELNIPVNSIGAILARARKKLRGDD